MTDNQNLSLDESLDHDVSVGQGEKSYIDHNAELNLFSPEGQIQFEEDKKAARQYFLTHVNPNTVYFHNIEEKLEYLVEHGYYEKEILDKYIDSDEENQYCSEFIKELFKHVYNYKYRFDTFMGALKFYSSYSMKTNDGKRYLERYEDRIVMVALTLAEGDKDKAVKIADEIITGKLQPATPTFLNAGKKQRGEYVSCFPAGTPVMTDNGYKNIEDITIEDKVLSHDGLFHEVEEKIVNSNSERLVRIKHYGNKEDLLLTPNHPVLVWTNRNIDTLIDGDGADINKGFVWLESQDVTEEDFIVGANVNETKNQTINSEFYKIEDNKIVYQVKNVEITDDIPDTVYNLEVKDAHTYTVNNVIVHNCFLLRTEDSMESIANTITSSLQLSKRGGGVGILLTNIREQGSTIKNIEGASSGVIPVMKLLEDSFTYANQLGARQGAGAVYISACHPDVLSVLDTKRENADEKVRIKTLSIGLVIPDIAFEMARKNENLYLFSPKDVYDVYGVPMSDISITEKYHEMVEDPRISKKKISARHLFQTIAELQFESGYPYLMFEDTANQWNNIDGRINMSNLCSEILQINTPAEFDERGNVKEDAEGRDISCNLASLNIANVMKKGDFKDTVHTAIHSLTTVSDNTNISIVPNVRNGNEKSHSIGLGTMNLHGFLGSEKIHYGSDEALDFTNVFYATLRYHSLQASMELAKDKGTFYDFNKSDYVKTNDQGYSKALENYTNGTWETFPHTQRIKEMYHEYDQWYPQQEDWKKLDKEIQEHGLYHAYLNANAPTGNISYVNNSTSSLHPIVAKIEARKQSGLGRVYYPAYGLTNDNLEYYDDAYEIGYKAIIDTYAVAGKHIDQGQSLTLFFKNTDTTRTLNKAYNYAWSRGKEKNEYGEIALYDPRTSWKTGIVKTLYYSRIRSDSIEGTELEGCVSCTI